MTYLGFVIGPGVVLESWVKVERAIKATTRAIAGACLPASLGISVFNKRVGPLVDYVGQLLDPPSSFVKMQLW